MFPEIDLKIESETIVAKTRKLKAVWTYETDEQFRKSYKIEEIDFKIDSDLEQPEWGIKKKKKPAIRKITEDWEPSRLD